MCIIVDVNRMSAFLAGPPEEDAAPVRRWIDTGQEAVWCIPPEGSLRRKSAVTRGTDCSATPRLAGPSSSRRSVSLTTRTPWRGQIRSDDPHVLALARATGVRLLYTGDADLIADFKEQGNSRQAKGEGLFRCGQCQLADQICMWQAIDGVVAPAGMNFWWRRR